jgi:hypothetical protein
MHDMSGQVATGRDSRYSLTIDEVAEFYARAGHPRTPRSIQRYCASGHLDGIKASTMLGDKYFIDPASVARHISQIEELVALHSKPTGLDTSRQGATQQPTSEMDDSTRQETAVSSPVAATQPDLIVTSKRDQPRQEPTPAPDSSRQVATEDAFLSRHVALLEREVERLTEDKNFLRDQVKTKDEQIAALLERDRETNFLVQGLQKMLSPLLGTGRHDVADDRYQN